MGRLGPGLLAILLIPAVAAIEDPAGDVMSSLGTGGGAPVDAPYIDIRNVTATVMGTDLSLRMDLAGAVSERPDGVVLRYMFLLNLDEGNLYDSTGPQNLFILCTLNTTAERFGCRDSQPDENVARPVIAAGYQGSTVTSTVRLAEADDSFTLGGATGIVEGNRTTANDFTDNALPYTGRPTESTTTLPAPGQESPAWSIGLLIVALACLARRQRA